MQEKTENNLGSSIPLKSEVERMEEHKTIRTYEDDVAEALKEKGGSLGSVFIAESKRRESEGAERMHSGEKGNRKKILIVLLIVIFSSISIGLIGFSVWNIFLKSEFSLPIVSETLIPSDSVLNLDVTGLSPDEFLNLLKQKRDESTGSLGSIIAFNLYVRKETIGSSSFESAIDSEDFFKFISSKAPGKLYRSLSGQFLPGAHLFDGNQPFLIFRVDSYQNAFAGMIEWEKYIKNDLSVFFEVKNRLLLNDTYSNEDNSSLTSTSTEEVALELPPASENFEDLVVRNKDVRALKNENGQIIFLYSFPDRQTLVITTNENTFRELLDRLSVTKFKD